MKIIAANWKMHPLSEKEAIKIARASDATNAIIFPPELFLKSIKKVLKKSSLGAQDVFWENGVGAYTGGTSISMLVSAGAKYVLIGHSERRAIFKESNDIVMNKFVASYRGGMKVIFCIGEPWNIRREGLSAINAFMLGQLSSVFKKISRSEFDPSKIIVAYEPIWAIGKGKTAFPEDAEFAAQVVKKWFVKRYGSSPRVLYGGSVDSKNSRYFLEQPSIDGVLVGGASVIADEIKQIIKLSR